VDEKEEEDNETHEQDASAPVAIAAAERSRAVKFGALEHSATRHWLADRE